MKKCKCCFKSGVGKKALITRCQWQKIKKGTILKSKSGRSVRMVLKHVGPAVVLQHAHDPLKETAYWYTDIYYKYKVYKL